MTENLKPCPFCKGKVEVIKDCDSHKIKCQQCHTVFTGFESKEETIKAWNASA